MFRSSTAASSRIACLLVLLVVLLPLTHLRSTVAQEKTADEACVFTPDSPLVVTIDSGEEADLSFDSGCNAVVSTSTNTDTSEEVAGDGKYGTISTEAKAPDVDPIASEAGGSSTASSSSAVCNGSSRVHDIIHLTLNHQRAHYKWYFNYSTNTGRSFSDSGSDISFLLDGWSVSDGPFALWYLFDPYVQGSESWVSFQYLFGSFEIEHRVILSMYPNGTCSGTFYFTGSICGSCHIHSRVYVS